MKKRLYRVNEVSRLSGVTVRALHHYDSIGLLIPSARTDAGYRLYGDEDLLRLQQILINKELGMPLETIRRMLDEPGFDRVAALLEQRAVLQRRAEGTARMIRAIDAALEIEKGDERMRFEDLFDGFDPTAHEEESRRRWGRTDAYKESTRRTKSYTKEDWARIHQENTSLMKRLAAKLAHGVDPTRAEVRDLAEEHRLHIDRWFYPCSRAVHSALADMYVSDERFKAAFDEHGEGLADFLVRAIRANAVQDT